MEYVHAFAAEDDGRRTAAYIVDVRAKQASEDLDDCMKKAISQTSPALDEGIILVTEVTISPDLTSHWWDECAKHRVNFIAISTGSGKNAKVLHAIPRCIFSSGQEIQWEIHTPHKDPPGHESGGFPAVIVSDGYKRNKYDPGMNKYGG